MSRDARPRISLLFLPYRAAGDALFSDGSGYLAVFWNRGNPAGAHKHWYTLRAYTTGYVSPSGTNWDLAEGIGPPLGVRRFSASKAVQRPSPTHSYHVVRRLNDAVAIFTGSVWDDPDDDTPVEPAPWYVPFASGTPPAVHGRNADNNDAPFLAANMCYGLHTIPDTAYLDPCKCLFPEGGPCDYDPN